MLLRDKAVGSVTSQNLLVLLLLKGGPGKLIPAVGVHLYEAIADWVPVREATDSYSSISMEEMLTRSCSRTSPQKSCCGGP
jgi:hypothetical protein